MKTRNLVRNALGALAFTAAAAMSTGSNAALINSLFTTGVNEVQDTDVESVYRDGVQVRSGGFAVGDVIVGVLQFNTANATNISQGLGTLNYQLTAYFQLRVANIIDNGDGTSTLVFSDTTGTTDALPNLAGANDLVDIYENPTAFTFDQTVPVSGGIASATTGNLLATIGLNGTDDFWTAVVPTTNGISAVAALTAASPQIGIGQFGLTVFTNPGGLPISPNSIMGADGNLHDVIGNASAYGVSPHICGNTTTPASTTTCPDPLAGWLVSSNTTVQFVTRVPEPGTLALLGGSLAVFAFIRRRKNGDR